MPPFSRTDLYERYLFNTRVQNPDEPLNDFLETLTQLSKNCKYEKDGSSPKQIGILIRDRFISGMKNKNAQEQLLKYESRGLPIEKVVDLAKMFDSIITSKASLEIENDFRVDKDDVYIKKETAETKCVIKSEAKDVHELNLDTATENKIDNATSRTQAEKKNSVLDFSYEVTSDDFETLTQDDLLQLDIEGNFWVMNNAKNTTLYFRNLFI